MTNMTNKKTEKLRAEFYILEQEYRLSPTKENSIKVISKLIEHNEERDKIRILQSELDKIYQAWSHCGVPAISVNVHELITKPTYRFDFEKALEKDLIKFERLITEQQEYIETLKRLKQILSEVYDIPGTSEDLEAEFEDLKE